MPTLILVLENDRNNAHWLARKWGSSAAALKPCTYQSTVNKVFNKDPGDTFPATPCTTLTDEQGNQANAFMVQLANT